MPHDSHEDKLQDWSERVVCPKCRKPVPTEMNLCFIARRDCPHCGAVLLIEGDTVTEEESNLDKS
jgi:hypothetical protein